VEGTGEEAIKAVSTHTGLDASTHLQRIYNPIAG